MTYTRNQVLLAFFAGIFLVSIALNPIGILVLLGTILGSGTTKSFVFLTIYLLFLLSSLWMLKQELTTGVAVSGVQVAIMAMVTIGVLLFLWFALGPELLVGYVGMPRRIHPK